MRKSGDHRVLFVEPLNDDQLKESIFLSMPLPAKIGSCDISFKFKNEEDNQNLTPKFKLGKIAIDKIFSNPQEQIISSAPDSDINYEVFSHSLDY